MLLMLSGDVSFAAAVAVDVGGKWEEERQVVLVSRPVSVPDYVRPPRQTAASGKSSRTRHTYTHAIPYIHAPPASPTILRPGLK
jgi:hypothetical protein